MKFDITISKFKERENIKMKDYTRNPFEFIGDILDLKKFDPAKHFPYGLDGFKDAWNDTLDFVLGEENSVDSKSQLSYHIETGEKTSKIFINVAGIRKQDIKISISKSQLKVDFPKKNFWEKIKPVQNGRITFKIGSRVDVNNIQSLIEDGVLVISIDKTLDKKIEEEKVIEIK